MNRRQLIARFLGTAAAGVLAPLASLLPVEPLPLARGACPRLPFPLLTVPRARIEGMEGWHCISWAIDQNRVVRCWVDGAEVDPAVAENFSPPEGIGNTEVRRNGESITGKFAWRLD